MVRLTGRGSTSSSEEDGETIEVVTQEMTTGQAAAGQLPRTSSSNTIGSGATTPSSGSRRRPSLVFAADDDSGSDSLTGPSGPRRRCSIVSSEDGLPDIMDLRRAVDGSDHGSKSAYDLSVCSDSSFETMRTEDAMEKVGMFEVALSSSFKKAEAAKKNDSVEHSDHSSDDERKPVGLINVMLARSRRSTMETIWSATCSPRKRERRDTAKRSPQSDSILVHSSLVINPDDDSISKKLSLEESKSSRRKAHIRRCAQAAIVFVALSMFVISTIYLAMEDAADPLSRSFSSFATKTEHLLDMVFSSSSEEEEEVQFQQEGLAEPSVVQAEVAEEERRHDARIRNREENRRRREEENRLRRERVAKNRQARIDAQEDKRRTLIQEQRVNENLRGGGGVNPEFVQEHVLPANDFQSRRKALLHTFVPIN